MCGRRRESFFYICIDRVTKSLNWLDAGRVLAKGGWKRFCGSVRVSDPGRFVSHTRLSSAGNIFPAEKNLSLREKSFFALDKYGSFTYTYFSSYLSDDMVGANYPLPPLPEYCL